MRFFQLYIHLAIGAHTLRSFSSSSRNSVFFNERAQCQLSLYYFQKTLLPSIHVFCQSHSLMMTRLHIPDLFTLFTCVNASIDRWMDQRLRPLFKHLNRLVAPGLCTTDHNPLFYTLYLLSQAYSFQVLNQSIYICPNIYILGRQYSFGGLQAQSCISLIVFTSIGVLTYFLLQLLHGFLSS